VGIKNKSFKLLITRVPEGCQSISLDLTLHEQFNDAVAIKRAAVQITARPKLKNVSRLAFCWLKSGENKSLIVL